MIDVLIHKTYFFRSDPHNPCSAVPRWVIYPVAAAVSGDTFKANKSLKVCVMSHSILLKNEM